MCVIWHVCFTRKAHNVTSKGKERNGTLEKQREREGQDRNDVVDAASLGRRTFLVMETIIMNGVQDHETIGIMGNILCLSWQEYLMFSDP